MIIAIDGPAASGKGTIARALARHYGVPHLDTGLLYRAVAAQVMRLDLDPATAAIGAPVALGWRDLADGRALPVFGPVSPPAQEARA